MANMKNLQMWKNICTKPQISINTSMFGLFTNIVYKPTGSKIGARILEFSSADGDQLKKILNSSDEDLAKAIGSFRPKQISNGNYLAEICSSADGAFLAIQLLKFSVLNYEPVTEALIFEGDDARTLKSIL